MSQLKSLVKDISVYGISEFLNRSVQVLFLPIIFAFLTTAEFGKLDLFLTTKNILAAVFGWGLITAVQRFGGIKTEDNYTLEEVITSSFMLAFVVDIVLGVISFLLYFMFFETDFLSFILVLFISVFYAFRSVVLGVLRLQHRAKEFLVVTLVNIIIYLVGTFILIKFTELNYIAFLVAGVIGISSSFFIGLFVIRKNLKLKTRKTLLISVFKFGASLLSTSLIVIFIASSNRYALSLFGDSLDEVGLLGMSNRLALFVGALLVAPFTLAWLPFVNENHKRDDFKYLTNTVFKYLIIIGLLLTTLLVIFAYPILTFFGKITYLDSLKIVPYFCFSYIFQSGYYIFSSSFYINEENKRYVYSAILTLIVNIILLGLVIPYISYVTVSIVTMLTYFLQMIYSYYYSSNNFKMLARDIVKVATFMVSCGALISLIVFLYETESSTIVRGSVSFLVLTLNVLFAYLIFGRELQIKILLKKLINNDFKRN